MLTSTQMLHKAAGCPPVADLVDAEAWDALRNTSRKPSYAPGGPCYICGEDVGGSALPVAQRVGKTWTAHDLCVAPASEWLCPACVYCMQEKSDARPDMSAKFTFRAFTHFVHDESWEVLRLSDKVRMAEVLLDPPSVPWFMAISPSPTSAPHTVPFTPVNVDRQAWAVNFGGQIVTALPNDFAGLIDAAQALYSLGFYKAEIESGEYLPLRIAEHLAAWQVLESQVKAWRGSPLLDLVVFLLQKEEK